MVRTDVYICVRIELPQRANRVLTDRGGDQIRARNDRRAAKTDSPAHCFRLLMHNSVGSQGKTVLKNAFSHLCFRILAESSIHENHLYDIVEREAGKVLHLKKAKRNERM